MPIYDEIPSSLDLRERSLICIGRFIADWANCESSFSWIFSRVIGAEIIKSDIIWLSINSTAARMDLLRTLIKVEPKIAPATKAEIENCITEFRVVTELRNYYCHAIYTTADDMNLTSVDKWRLAKPSHADAVKGKTRPISDEHLRELCSAIDQCADINRHIIRVVSNLEAELSKPAG
jgi:hypothetical protein